ncbi:2-iminoacetate synthase ThiH [Nannocystis sp. SCPEA4]|uniref:2-iminoacetate synthase ThiH n=1 Tax=Nannocystis sp. SCPEA4 TaxID=2996787 RepID=UPI00226FB547|nr:2-iminoacetate synthase ThiH [Nannocystis sp. SCPEA4]MCY1060408.1 2-iminoacetate synthase ThiH [Nannocystis sp. SCPEA4]
MSTFSTIYPQLPIAELVQRSLATTDAQLAPILRRGHATSLEDVAALLSPAAALQLPALAERSGELAQRRFGRAIRLFAPLYLSNECVNVCTYCGFSRTNQIPRITISVEHAARETSLLRARGIGSLLIVAGEHPKFVSNGYVEAVIRAVLPIMPDVSIEIGPLEAPAYVPMVAAGCAGLVVYQETYHEPTYRAVHTAGPKKRYRWRMDAAERGLAAGFRRLGLGALYGLHDFRFEALSLAAHADHLRRTCPEVQLAISVPRLRPAAGEFQPDPRHVPGDAEFLAIICALRLFLPEADIIVSTRESAALRDRMVSIGVTTMSAGASTEPGGYSEFEQEAWTPARAQPGEQFHIADERPPQAVAAMIRRRGYLPVWQGV